MTEKSSYLAKDRLGDVISAIQVMGSNEAFAARVDYWAERITGDKKAAAQCEIILQEHREFFRRFERSDGEEYYSLVWRHCLPYLDKETGQTISSSEFRQRAGHGTIGRRPLTPEEIKSLTEIAIELHAKAVEQSRDWRWWVPLAASFLGVVVGALIGFFGAVTAAGIKVAPISSPI